jgi:hypothetical protein
VTRATTSVFVAAILVFVLFGGPCLACASLFAGGVNHSCCDPKNGCGDHSSGSPTNCAPNVDFTNVEQPSASIVVSFAVLDVGRNVDIRTPQLNAAFGLSDPVPHSLPDLCLLHSVLTI